MSHGPAPAMDVVVKKVLGSERDEQGRWAVLLEVEIGGTVQELCRLVFPTEAETAPAPGTLLANGQEYVEA